MSLGGFTPSPSARVCETCGAAGGHAGWCEEVFGEEAEVSASQLVEEEGV